MHPVDPGVYCAHSLQLADLNRDGRLDIIVGEMTAGGWDFPLQDNPKIYAYMNRGGLAFTKNVLIENAGVHEMGLLRDGEAIVLYAADEIQLHKFPDMNTNVNLWRIKPVFENKSE
jgi:hypothetical protein